MNRSTRSRTRSQMEADDTLSSNDKSGAEEEKESKTRTDKDQLEVKRRKLCHCEENAAEKNVTQTNPIVDIGNKLKWKFENVNELNDISHPNGMNSDIFTFQNLDWFINIYTHTDKDSRKKLVVYLFFGGNAKRTKENWLCETKSVKKILNQNKNGEEFTKECNVTYDNRNSWGYPTFIEWSKLESGGCIKDNSIIVEIEFDFQYYDFSINIPNYTDIILNVEDTKFYVNKGVLCSRSAYFFNKFVVENSEEKELTIENVKVEDFNYFIASFCLFFESVKGKNYEQLMQLATKYKTPQLHRNCEKFLISDKKIKTEKKIMLADKYNYKELLKTCINSLTTPDQVKEIRKSVEFENLKDTTKLSIMSHLLNLF